MDHDEVAELLGAWALDALEPEELRAIDDHLRACPRCAVKAREFSEVAGKLASSVEEPSPHIWNAIEANLRPRSARTSAPLAPARRHRAQHLRLAPIAASIAVLVGAAGLSGVAVLNQRLTRLEHQLAHAHAQASIGLSTLAADIATEPGTRVVTLLDRHNRSCYPCLDSLRSWRHPSHRAAKPSLLANVSSLGANTGRHGIYWAPRIPPRLCHHPDTTDRDARCCHYC